MKDVLVLQIALDEDLMANDYHDHGYSKILGHVKTIVGLMQTHLCLDWSTIITATAGTITCTKANARATARATTGRGTSPP